MSGFHPRSAPEFKIDNIEQKIDKILTNQSLIIKLLGDSIIKQQPLESIIRLRDEGTNTPDIITRCQSTQSPININETVDNGENKRDCPIQSRWNAGSPEGKRNNST
tara:strand:- start:486 stop:806 length:321 start_codon:yes stop_codon:yes gene_type:complete